MTRVTSTTRHDVACRPGADAVGTKVPAGMSLILAALPHMQHLMCQLYQHDGCQVLMVLCAVSICLPATQILKHHPKALFSELPLKIEAAHCSKLPSDPRFSSSPSCLAAAEVILSVPCHPQQHCSYIHQRCTARASPVTPHSMKSKKKKPHTSLRSSPARPLSSTKISICQVCVRSREAQPRARTKTVRRPYYSDYSFRSPLPLVVRLVRTRVHTHTACALICKCT